MTEHVGLRWRRWLAATVAMVVAGALAFVAVPGSTGTAPADAQGASSLQIRLVDDGGRTVKLTGWSKGGSGALTVDRDGPVVAPAFQIKARTRIAALSVRADGCGVGAADQPVTSRTGATITVPTGLSPGTCVVEFAGRDATGATVAEHRLDLTVRLGTTTPPAPQPQPPAPQPEPEPPAPQPPAPDPRPEPDPPAPDPQPQPEPQPEPPSPGPVDESYGRLVWTDDFSPGRENRWPNYQDTTAPQNRQVINDPTGAHDRVLRVSFAEGVVGPKGGTQFKSTFEPRAESATLVYSLRFGEGFEQVKGGKLPGFTGGPPGRSKEKTGGDQPDGTDGWSVRLGFRDSRTSPGSLALRTYSYLPPNQQNAGVQNDEYLFDAWGNKTFWSGQGQWGISHHFLDPDAPAAGQDLILQPGEWYRVAVQVNLNTHGRKDGSIKAWIQQPGESEARLAIHVPDLTFRNPGHGAEIDRIFFSTFFGGASASHAPVQDEHIDFADFALYIND
ncbi:MAG: polysaccharide lyase [Actinomycetota bacterium]